MSDEVKKFLDEYCDFVTKVTSELSLDQDALINRMKEIIELISIPQDFHRSTWLRLRVGELLKLLKCFYRASLLLKKTYSI